MEQKTKKPLVVAACSLFMGFLGFGMYASSPDYQKSKKILEEQHFSSIVFTPFTHTATCNSDIHGWFATDFNAVSPKGDRVSGVVCFSDRKQTEASIQFSQKPVLVVQPSQKVVLVDSYP